MPIKNFSHLKMKEKSIIKGKIQSQIWKNALQLQRLQRLKKFQTLQKSFSIKQINIKRPLQYLKVVRNQSIDNKKGSFITNRQAQNPISTIDSLKQKIKTLEKDQISDADLENKIIHLRYKSHEPDHHKAEKQARDMIHNYRKARNQANQFRSQKVLKIIQIRKTLGQDRHKPEVKSLQLANRTSNDFMRSVYLKFINGYEQKNRSVKKSDNKNISLVARKIHEQRMTNYRSRTETFQNDFEEVSRKQVRSNRVKLFKAMHNLNS